MKARKIKKVLTRFKANLLKGKYDDDITVHVADALDATERVRQSINAKQRRKKYTV